MSNMILPAAWSQAAPLSNVFGDNFSICLASGGQIVATASDKAPDEPAATALHCSVCLFTGGIDTPAAGSNPLTLLNIRPVVLSYGYTEPAFTTRFRGLKFDARAPPA